MCCEISSGMYFSILSRTFRHCLDEAAQKKGLTGVQMMVMAQLHGLESSGMKEIRQRDLEQAVHLSHPTMTDIIKRLERKGLVECVPSRSDRRSKAISSTPCAQAFHEEMARVDSAVFEKLCEGLSDSQRQELSSMLKIMLGNALAMRKEVCDCND